MRACISVASTGDTYFFDKEEDIQGKLNPNQGRRHGEVWHIVLPGYAKLLICLNKTSSCDYVKSQMQDFKDKGQSSKTFKSLTIIICSE